MTTEHTIFAILDTAIDDHIAQGNNPNAVLLGKTEWGFFLSALDSIGMVLPPGRIPRHRGCQVYPVEVPDLIQCGKVGEPYTG